MRIDDVEEPRWLALILDEGPQELAADTVVLTLDVDAHVDGGRPPQQPPELSVAEAGPQCGRFVFRHSPRPRPEPGEQHRSRELTSRERRHERSHDADREATHRHGRELVHAFGW